MERPEAAASSSATGAAAALTTGEIAAALPAGKAAAAPPRRQGAAGPARRAAPKSVAQKKEAERAKTSEEDAPENTYEGIRFLLVKYKAWVEVEERTWRVGRIYTCLGICDMLARFSVLWLFRAQNGALRIASVSDTQALDYTPYGRPSDIEYSALVRLTIAVSAGFIRSVVSCFLLWKAFPHLRPSWHGKPTKRRAWMKADQRARLLNYTYLFRLFVCVWCLFDIIQICVPEDSKSDKVTPHRVFKIISEAAFFLAHALLLKTLRHDRQALLPFVYAGYIVMILIVLTGLWLDLRISYRRWVDTKTLWACCQWTFMVEMQSAIIFVGFAMPDNLFLSMGFHVLRTGKALPGEDDSFFNPPLPPKRRSSFFNRPPPMGASSEASPEALVLEAEVANSETIASAEASPEALVLEAEVASFETIASAEASPEALVPQEAVLSSEMEDEVVDL